MLWGGSEELKKGNENEGKISVEEEKRPGSKGKEYCRSREHKVIPQLLAFKIGAVHFKKPLKHDLPLPAHKAHALLAANSLEMHSNTNKRRSGPKSFVSFLFFVFFFKVRRY
jgi:hypothetical protein